MGLPIGPFLLLLLSFGFSLAAMLETFVEAVDGPFDGPFDGPLDEALEEALEEVLADAFEDALEELPQADVLPGVGMTGCPLPATKFRMRAIRIRSKPGGDV